MVDNDDISLDGFVIYSVPVGTLSSLTLDGVAGNRILLTVDSSAAYPFPSGGITFHGGGQSGDKLVTKGVPAGGSYSTITSTYTSGVPVFAGSIVFVGSQTDTLNYDGVQAGVDISGSTATNLVFQLPPAGSSAFLEDDGTPNNNFAQLRSGNNTFATTRFGTVSGTATIKPGNAADTLTVNDLSFRDFLANLAIGAAGSEFSSVTFAGTLTLAGGKSVSANATGTISLPNSTSNIVSNTTGGAVTLTTARNISLSSGSRISTFGGPITLSANQQAMPTSGNFVGVDINGGEIEAPNSVLIIKGRGGDDSSGSQHGVRLRSNAIVSGGHSGLQITGVAGGSGTSSNNIGVFIDGASGGIASAAHWRRRSRRGWFRRVQLWSFARRRVYRGN